MLTSEMRRSGEVVEEDPEVAVNIDYVMSVKICDSDQPRNLPFEALRQPP